MGLSQLRSHAGDLRGHIAQPFPRLPRAERSDRCKVEARDREDYVGHELVQTDGEGRPVMSVVTTRDDGQDCAVYAPCASAKAES